MRLLAGYHGTWSLDLRPAVRCPCLFGSLDTGRPQTRFTQFVVKGEFEVRLGSHEIEDAQHPVETP